MPPKRSPRFPILAIPALLLTLASSGGCDPAQPDLGGAVVVPEPGTSPSLGESGADAPVDAPE